jgi:hypothetical protein
MRVGPFAAALGLLGLLCVMPAGAGGPDATARPLTASEHRALRRAETVYVWRMTEAVAMTESQAAQIFPRVREAFQTRWPLAARRRELLVLLRRTLDESPASDQLGTLLTQWHDNETKLRASRQLMWETLARVLTAEQQVRCLLFEEEFQGDLVRVLEEHRRNQSRPASPPPESRR